MDALVHLYLSEGLAEPVSRARRLPHGKPDRRLRRLRRRAGSLPRRKDWFLIQPGDLNKLERKK